MEEKIGGEGEGIKGSNWLPSVMKSSSKEEGF